MKTNTPTISTAITAALLARKQDKLINSIVSSIAGCEELYAERQYDPHRTNPDIFDMQAEFGESHMWCKVMPFFNDDMKCVRLDIYELEVWEDGCTQLDLTKDQVNRLEEAITKRSIEE